MKVDRKDAGTAAIFIVTGLFFGYRALSDLTIGSLLRMGPGYFPLMLSAILILLGAIVGVRSFGRSGTPFGAVSWRAITLISAAPILFGILIGGLGLVPATATAVVVTSLAERDSSLRFVVALTIGLTLFCLVIFRIALQLPLPAFGPWLTW